jgi:hypothetical protein
MQNKQFGCAYLLTPKDGKQSAKSGYNSVTYGLPNLRQFLYKGEMLQHGLISSLTISNLSSKGGTGSGTLVTLKGKAYTSGTITLIGREAIKIPGDADELFRDILTSE